MLRVEVPRRDRAPDLVQFHSVRTVEVQGVISRSPEAAGAATRVRMRVEGVRSGDRWTQLSDALLVTVSQSPALVRLRDRPYFRYGDRLSLTGTLKEPQEFDEFDYPAYLARQGIHSVMDFPQVTLLEANQGPAFYRCWTPRAVAWQSLWPRSCPSPRRPWARPWWSACETASPTT